MSAVLWAIAKIAGVGMALSLILAVLWALWRAAEKAEQRAVDAMPLAERIARDRQADEYEWRHEFNRNQKPESVA